MQKSRDQISSYYNEFSLYLRNSGVNIRHRRIFSRLKRIGLNRQSNVLEIGCGIGQVTGLIARSLNAGTITAVDISESNIQYAQKRLKSYSNIQFHVNDMSDFTTDMKYDFVVLPDVLEHVPLEQHAKLFQFIGEHTHSKSVVYINIPSPHCQAFMSQYHPELQQIVDLSLWTELLLPSFHVGGFYIHSLINYQLTTNEFDYQEIILKKKIVLKEVTYRSKFSLIKQELVMRLRMLLY